VHLIQGSAGMTVAVDRTGVIHVAAAASVAGTNTVVYGRCAAQCDQASSWQMIPLAPGASVSHVPTILVTEDARPRILYAVSADVAASPGYYYLECDAGCDQNTGWHSVQLTNDDPAPNAVWSSRMPFAVSEDGAAAFAYHDGFNMYLWVCTSRCGAGTSWTRVTIADAYVYAEAVAFAPGQSLVVIGRHAVRDNETMVWFDCPSKCTSRENWAGLDPLWTTRGAQTVALAPTAKGGARILVYGDDPNTAVGSRVFAYLSCDTRCRNLASWNPPVAPPLAPDSASIGFALAEDDSGGTVVATVGDAGSSLARCLRDCASLAGQWQKAPGVGVPDLESRLPPTVPAGCLSATWGMYGGPSLTIDPHGTPLVAFTAYVKAFGGDCGTGSRATRSDSFLYTP
jgi:hypothetical protein